MSDGLNEQDIVGIYRLCGATTKKNILRLAFEESADIVDLSSMNVPDINVITSEFASSIRSFHGALPHCPSGSQAF